MAKAFRILYIIIAIGSVGWCLWNRRIDLLGWNLFILLAIIPLLPTDKDE